MTIPGPEPLLSTADVATRLAVTPAHVLRYILAGQLPATNVGLDQLRPEYRISPSALRLFRERRRVVAR